MFVRCCSSACCMHGAGCRPGPHASCPKVKYSVMLKHWFREVWRFLDRSPHRGYAMWVYLFIYFYSLRTRQHETTYSCYSTIRKQNSTSKAQMSERGYLHNTKRNKKHCLAYIYRTLPLPVPMQLYHLHSL